MKFDIRGARGADAPAVILSAGLGGLAHFWAPQLEALADRFCTVTYDHRGTGRNAERLPSPYSIAMMADDVIGILDSVGIDDAHFIGHALGGLIGLELAARNPSRIKSLVAVNAWAAASQHTLRCFEMRRALLLASGIEAYVKAQPIFLYPAAWIEAHAARIARDDTAGVENFQGADNLLGRIDALASFDITARLPGIRQPVLVAASRDDMLVPWTRSQHLAAVLPQAELWVTPEGGHAFSVVDPASFNSRLLAFLRRW